MELSRVNKKKIITVISVLCLLGLIILILASATLSKDTMYSNIYIEEVNIGGLSVPGAEEKLISYYDSKLASFELQLKYGDKSWIIKPDHIDYTLNFQLALDKAYEIGRYNSLIDSIKEIFTLRKDSIVIPLEASHNEKLLDEYIETVRTDLDCDPVNASIRRNNSGFEIIDEVVGISVNHTSTKESILASLGRLDSKEIELPVDTVLPTVTREQLSSIDHIVSEFKTSFNPQIVGRVRNIEVAAGRVNGTLLMPTDIFSFNDITGLRSRAGGYHEAPVIVNGRLVPGVGGGVCQVSTTLYNAVIRSDLKIIERRNHSLPVSYVPLGQDATVTDDYIDFKFQNNKSYPIYIESYITADTLYTRIYGKKKDNIVIQLQSEIMEVISPKVEIKKDPNLVVGERKIIHEAKNGYRVDTYKVYFESGVQIKREHISRDYYAPVNGEIIEGVKKVDIPNNEEAEEVNIEEPESEAID